MTDARIPDTDRDLAERLDQAVPPHTRRVAPPDADPLVATAQRLARGPNAVFSSAALDRIEARLNAQMDRMARSTPQAAPRRRAWWGGLGRLAAAVAIVVMVLFATVTQAAAALPGDRLYPVKRAVEDIRLALVTQDGEAELRLSLAERRIREFEALLERGEVYPRALEEANDQMTYALDQLDAGYGDWTEVDLRFDGLLARNHFLLEQAAVSADAEQRDRLNAVSAGVNSLQQHRARLTPAAAPALPATPVRPAPTSTPPPTPIASATKIPARTRTPMPQVTPGTAATQHPSTGVGNPGGPAEHVPTHQPPPAQGGDPAGRGENPPNDTPGQGGAGGGGK